MHVSPRASDPQASSVSDTTRPSRELLFVLIAAWALVIVRCFVFTAYEHSFFDSDQAVFALMAKHIIEGRAFPVFMYGQTYLLALDSYMSVPFFLAFGPTVAAMRLALMTMNGVIATTLIVALVRWGGLRPLYALAASMFFTFAPPLTGASLVEACGNIGQFLYIVLLFLLRRRALWFGLVLAIGFLYREFTIFAVPMLLIGDLWQRRIFTGERLRFWLVAFAACLATWQSLQALKPYSDMMGPGTRGQLIRGEGGSQIGNISDRVAIVPSALPGRTLAMVRDHLPKLMGTRRSLHLIASQGRDWLFWPISLGLAAALLRAAWLARRPGTLDRAAFGWYLIGVGATAAAAYIATRPAQPFIDRYALLAIYLPVGVVAVYLATEGRLAGRLAILALVAVWSASSGVDHAAQIARYWGGREPDELRVLAGALADRRIHVAEAGYWRAYKISFITREQVKVASTDVVRIDEYQRLANEAGDGLIRIAESPCTGGEQVGGWYLCPTKN